MSDDELKISAGLINGNVILQFDREVGYIGGDAEWADNLAEVLMEYAEKLRLLEEFKVTTH